MIFKAVTRVSLVYSFNEVGLRLRHSRDLSPKRSTDTLSRRTYLRELAAVAVAAIRYGD